LAGEKKQLFYSLTLKFRNKDINLKSEGEFICVELFAEGSLFALGKNRSRPRIFAGAVGYEVIANEYASVKKSLWGKRSTHFFNLKVILTIILLIDKSVSYRAQEEKVLQKWLFFLYLK
jgi:hypothetical protein